MNEQLQRYLENIKNYYLKLPRGKRIFAGVLGGVVLMAAVITALILRQDPMQMLYSDLRAEESKGIVKKLSEKNIPYHISEDQSSISVPSSKVYQARMELAKEGLPGQDVVGFEKFDASTLGMSSYVQRIQYVRAVQGELIRSIQRLASVKTARVHISVPPKKTFLEEEDPPKASVVLELKQGQVPSKSEIAGIAHLVASAVEGLKVNQITIVDTKGAFLHRPEDGATPAIPTALLEMQRSIESEYERRIEDLLTPVVGFGKVRAKVTTEIDPSRVNTTEESYDPEKAVPKTTVKTDEVTTGSRPNPVGIPGSRSNLPGSEVTNPGVPMATNNSEKNTTNTNYAIPRKISVTDKPSGNIKRLTVAVVVDGHYAKGQGNETETFAPRTEEELKRLRDIVANAVGFDEQRRDSITISSLPFRNTDLLPAEEVPASKFDLNELMKHGVRNGLIGLVILLFFFLVLRPFLKWTTGADDAKKKIKDAIPQMLPKTVAELEAAVQGAASVKQLGVGGAAGIPGEVGAAGTSGGGDVPGGKNAAEELLENERAAGGAMSKESEAVSGTVEPSMKKEEEDLKSKILELLQKSPKKGIRVVQDWLEDDGGMHPSEG